jgi:hypothetical protein
MKNKPTVKRPELVSEMGFRTEHLRGINERQRDWEAFIDANLPSQIAIHQMIIDWDGKSKRELANALHESLAPLRGDKDETGKRQSR